LKKENSDFKKLPREIKKKKVFAQFFFLAHLISDVIAAIDAQEKEWKKFLIQLVERFLL
jgi:hypothetical protein